MKCFFGNIYRVTHTKKQKKNRNQPTKQANKMSFQSTTKQENWSIRPTVQCDNPSCRSWNDEPIPGTKCFKCLSILPTWVGYLNNNSGGDGEILEVSNYPPPPPLERTAGQERELWYADEVNDKPLKLTRTDGNAEQEEKEHIITNAEQVVRDMMSIYKLDREGALRKFDEIIKNVIVTHY